jgi:hypothetical protein
MEKNIKEVINEVLLFTKTNEPKQSIDFNYDTPPEFLGSKKEWFSELKHQIAYLGFDLRLSMMPFKSTDINFFVIGNLENLHLIDKITWKKEVGSLDLILKYSIIPDKLVDPSKIFVVAINKDGEIKYSCLNLNKIR